MGTELATCSCGAMILWAKTSRGARMPLNATPDPKGDVIVCLGVVTVLRDDQNPQTLGRYQSHWRSCPHSREHRKPRPKPAPAPIAGLDF